MTTRKANTPQIPLSNLYYPNRMGRIYLMAMEEALGRPGLNALLNMHNMEQFVEEYPPDNLEKAFDFTYISNFNLALENAYGAHKSRSIILRAGRALFARGLRQFGMIAGVGDLAFKILPLDIKLRIGLTAIARIFSQFSDQTSTVEESGDCYYYYIHRCSMCWGRSCQRPVGFTAIGILQEALSWVSNGLEFRIEELECMGMGAERGVFRIDKEPIN